MVTTWVAVAGNYPQAAYAGFTFCLQNEWQYVQRVTSDTHSPSLCPAGGDNQDEVPPGPAGGRYLQMIVAESRSGGGLKGGSRELGHFDSHARTTGITSSATPLMTTTTCVMLSLQLSIPLPRLVGRCVCSPLYSR